MTDGNPVGAGGRYLNTKIEPVDVGNALAG